MTQSKKTLRVATLVGFLITLPFMLLEWSTQSNLPRSEFPTSLFAVLWIEVTVFLLLVSSIIQTLREKKKNKRNYVALTLKAVFAGILGASWLTLMMDQMPCFLGATGC